MYGWSKLHKNESGQAALEAAIILIAFVVVASVFAFAILSAGSASTEKGEQAIYSGLQGVQSSMEIKGAVTANGTAGTSLNEVVFTLALVAGGEPVNLADGLAACGGATNTPLPVVVIAYRDGTQAVNSVPFCVTWIRAEATADDLLEENELAQVTVDLTDLSPVLGANKAFTLEVKPPTGAILGINRTTPAAIEAVMELR